MNTDTVHLKNEEHDDTSHICSNNEDHERLVKLVELAVVPTSYEGYSTKGEYLEPRKFNNKFRKELYQVLKDIDLFYEEDKKEYCVCGVLEHHTVSFWKTFDLANIRIDVLKYMIDNKFLDITDDRVQTKMVNILSDLLADSNVENLPSMCDKIRELTLFLLDWLSSTVPEKLCEFRTGYCQYGLIQSALHGNHSEYSQDYVIKLLDLGVPLYRVVLPDKTGEFYCKKLIEQIEQLNIKEFGHTPVFSVACHGYEKSVKKMLEKKPFLDSYQESFDDRGDYKEKYYMFEPMILGVLEQCAEVKDVQFHKQVANCIKMLIDAGIDLSLPVLYGRSKTMKHNITDYLNYYGHNYKDSPIMEAFSGIKLPEPFDPEFAFFYEDRERDWIDNYHKLLNKYKYVKDPAKFKFIRKELDKLYKKGVKYHGGIHYFWRHVPIINEFIELVEQH